MVQLSEMHGSAFAPPSIVKKQPFRGIGHLSYKRQHVMGKIRYAAIHVDIPAGEEEGFAAPLRILVSELVER